MPFKYYNPAMEITKPLECQSEERLQYSGDSYILGVSARDWDLSGLSPRQKVGPNNSGLVQEGSSHT